MIASTTLTDLDVLRRAVRPLLVPSVENPASAQRRCSDVCWGHVPCRTRDLPCQISQSFRSKLSTRRFTPLGASCLSRYFALRMPGLSSGRLIFFPFRPAEPLDFIRLSRSRIFSPLVLAFASEFYLESAHVCVELSLLLPGFINSALSYLTYTTLFVVSGFWLLDFFELELCFCRDMDQPLAHASPSFLPFGSLKLRSQPIFLLTSKIWPRLRRNYFGFPSPSEYTETLWLLLVWKALRWEEHQAIIPLASVHSQSVTFWKPHKPDWD